MSDWATESTYEAVGTSAGFNVPLTLNLYDVGPGNSVGSVISSQTINAFVPWRPEADPTCPGGTAWRDGGGICWNGLAFEVTFDFSGVLVPDSIIYGLAFNTGTWGYAPRGAPGPYDSLNFGLADLPPTVGTNPFPIPPIGIPRPLQITPTVALAASEPSGRTLRGAPSAGRSSSTP